MSPAAKPRKVDDKRQKRSASRLYAVQALFQMEQSGQSVDRVAVEFLDHRFGLAQDEDGTALVEGDVDLFRQMTDRGLVAKWPIARIDPTLRALFRAAGAELVATETPPRVIINEYVDVARAFFPEGKEPKFVNAVLDHMAREARPEAF